MPMKNSENINKISEISLKTTELTKFAEQLSFVPENIIELVKMQNRILSNIEFPVFNFSKIEMPNFEHLKLNIPKFDFINSELLKTLKEFSKIGEQIKNNPELEFAFISNLEILNLKSTEEFKASLISNLTDKKIKQKEELLNENLLPYLEELKIHNLWLGANKVLESDNNPDKLRHCLISLRTILEYLIDKKLAPNVELKDKEKFKKEFKKYHLGKQKLEDVKVYRSSKIEYFTSKFKFGMLEEFTKNEIQYICDCYSVLCNVHQPDVEITENQVRSLKVKTGITIWLLVYLNKILKKQNTTHNNVCE
jgi:hypothetical protein